MNCTACCPKGLDPAKSIVHLKDMVSTNYQDGTYQLMKGKVAELASGRESGLNN
jgi:succinate dehydrogenase (ubiquinone) iron-sulfur subunit